MRKLLLFSALLVVSVVSAQDLWDGKTVATQFYGGSGTVTNPYQIRTGAELMYFANLVNAGDDFSGKTVKLMNDISLGDYALEVTASFAGTFDGNGHFIEQIFHSKAIFQSVKGVVKHLGVRFGVYRDDRYPYFGQIYLAQTLESGGLIENCYHELSKQRSNYDAYIIDYRSFLVGNNSGTIRNCFAKGNYRIYDASGAWGAYIIGMLVNLNNETGIVENCAASTYNNGVNDRGVQQPLITTNNGTVISGDNTTLDFFSAPDPCTVEYIDTLFHTSLEPTHAATGQPIGSLPIPDADCTFIGWNRFGNLVKESDVVNANWTLFAKWEQRIRKQPSIGSMRVEVDDVAHASFQWYAIYGEAQQYGNWQSTNHSDESTQSDTLTVTAKSGQQLKFSYTVSSEQGSDVFSFFCNGNKMLSASGEESGEFIYDIPADGTYKLVFRYSKDVDTRSGKDMAMVENIRVVDLDHLLPSTSASVGASNLDKSGLYYCKISYSNTGVILTTDTINVFKVTDISQIENTIYIEPVDGLRSTTIDLDVKMKNVLTAVGCSFTLILPEGVRLEKDADGDVVYELDSRARKQWVTLLDLGNGKYDCTLAPSTTAATIMGNDGALIKLRAIVPDDMAVGDYMLQLKNCMLQSKGNGTTTEHALIDVTTKLTVVDYVPGDVDGDGGLSFADVAMMTNHAIGKEQTGFNAKAADMNGDERVTIADIVIIIEKILKLEQAEE